MNELDKLKQNFEKAKNKYDNFLSDRSRDRTDADVDVQVFSSVTDGDETRMAFNDKIAVLTNEDLKQLQQITMLIIVSQDSLIKYMTENKL